MCLVISLIFSALAYMFYSENNMQGFYINISIALLFILLMSRNILKEKNEEKKKVKNKMKEKIRQKTESIYEKLMDEEDARVCKAIDENACKVVPGNFF